MWVPETNWRAASSFEQPVTPPSSEPDAAPLLCVSFNAEWLPYVLASLMQLTQPAAWNASPSAVLAVLDQATALIEQFIVGVDCVSALEFRFTAGCVLQYSLDGGSTWTDTPGWATFAAGCFTGPVGPAGPTGPAGPASTWRLNGCVLQYSNDGGTTWHDATGWSTDAIQACLSGTPGNPQQAITAQQACNVATWIAAEVVQASIGTIVSGVNTGKTILNTIEPFILAIPGLGEAVVLGVTAGMILYNGVLALGTAALGAAATDPVLLADLQCAIYSAIRTDGHVTSTNFATLVSNVNAISYGTAGVIGLIVNYLNALGFTGLNAIQSSGSLYQGDCSACSSPPSGCGVWYPDLFGNAVTYDPTAANPGRLTITAGTSSYNGAASSTGPSMNSSWQIQCTIVGTVHHGLGLYATPGPGFLNQEPPAGDWIGAMDYNFVWAAGSWAFLHLGTALATGSGGTAGDVLELRWDAAGGGAGFVECFINGSTVATHGSVTPGQLKPLAWGYDSGSSVNGLKLCTG